MTNSISVIKSQIMELFKQNSGVHLDIAFKNERRHFENVPAKITAVYPNIFIANIDDGGVKKKYTFQYADILTHNVDIKELHI